MAVSFSTVTAAPAATASLHNLPDGALADELGEVRARLADLKEREDAIRKELLGRGVSRADGELFKAVISRAVSWRIDSGLLKRLYGEDWVMTHSKLVEATSIRVLGR